MAQLKNDSGLGEEEIVANVQMDGVSTNESKAKSSTPGKLPVPDFTSASDESKVSTTPTRPSNPVLTKMARRAERFGSVSAPKVSFSMVIKKR